METLPIPVFPFRFQDLTFPEVIWDAAGPRLTREGMGWFFGAQHPVKYIEKLIARNPLLTSLGTEIEVFLPPTMTPHGGGSWSNPNSPSVALVGAPQKTSRKPVSDARSKQGGGYAYRPYKTLVYSPSEVYQFALCSDLPRARAFLRRFPEFQAAVLTHQLKPSVWARKGERTATLAQLASVPPGRARTALIRDVARLEGVSEKTVTSWLRHLGHRSRARRSDAGHVSDPEAKLQVEAFYAVCLRAGERPTTSRLAAFLREHGLAVSLSTAYRWTADLRGVRRRPMRRWAQGPPPALTEGPR